MPTLAPSITASNGPCRASHSWISQMFINRYIKYYKCFKQGEMEQVSSIHQGNAIYIFLYKKKESDNIISTSIFITNQVRLVIKYIQCLKKIMNCAMQ